MRCLRLPRLRFIGSSVGAQSLSGLALLIGKSLAASSGSEVAGAAAVAASVFGICVADYSLIFVAIALLNFEKRKEKKKNYLSTKLLGV